MEVRKIVFWLHLAAGVVAGSIIFVMSVTGVMLAFEHEIADWAERGARHAPPAGDAAPLSIDALLEKVRTQKPDIKPSGLIVYSDPALSARISLGRDGALYVDPRTGDIRGPGSKVHDVMHKIVDIHRYLGKREIGKPITGAANLAFFILVLSGFYLWWPRSWTPSKLASVMVLNTRLSGKARDWNWHNVLGFWSAPFLIVITLSGIVISYGWASNLVYRAAGENPPPSMPRPSGPALMPSVPLEPMLQTAKAKTPSWKSISLRFPSKADAPVMATIEENDPWYPAPRSQLSLNSATGEEVKWESYRDATPGRKARVWLRYLHTGEAGGIVGQILAMLASAAAVVLVWTGIAMAWRRWRG